ncbi:MAG: YifB family Mg chelatase-like AAA ATPase, partial [Minisyncoccia bacterium]
AFLGLEVLKIEIEVDVSEGLHSFNIVGLPDTALKEAKQRVSSAIKNIGALSPLRSNKKITINLAPADIKKFGSHYDLGIAIGYLLASAQIHPFDTNNKIFMGELALDGRIKPVTGILAVALFAEQNKYEYLIVPKANAQEAALAVKNTKIIGVNNLKELINFLSGVIKIEPVISNTNYYYNTQYEINLSTIKGQEKAKRALIIAASGGHNILMIGPPGSGKTLLAQAFLSILPHLNLEEAIEVTKIYSLRGLLNNEQPLITQRPFRAPHHSASLPALIGGGSYPQPGEITLAHRGILFLDELPEFKRDVLESLRQPLEEGVITIARAQSHLVFPAKFILVAAMNPCPCGYYGDPQKVCTCSPNDIIRYRKKISGPLLDRIDIIIEIPRLSSEEILSKTSEDNDEIIKNKIINARKIQETRFKQINSNKKIPIFTNSEMKVPEIEQFCKLTPEAEQFIKLAIDRFGLSGRSYHRILKIGRTIADLENQELINKNHLMEALQYKTEFSFNEY